MIDSTQKVSSDLVLGETSCKHKYSLLDPATGKLSRVIEFPAADFSLGGHRPSTSTVANPEVFIPANAETVPYFKIYGNAYGDMIQLIYRLTDDVVRALAGGMQ